VTSLRVVARYLRMSVSPISFIGLRFLKYLIILDTFFYSFRKCPASYVEGYPLDLSILLSGVKETKRDSPSNGERRGKSPSLNRVLTDTRCGVKVAFLGVA
jgi:hypothetical protein